MNPLEDDDISHDSEAYRETGIIAKTLALLIGLWPPYAFYLLVTRISFLLFA